MHTVSDPWDYLIVTASNEQQAAAYESQLGLRQKLGLITRVKKVMVVSDPEGKRVGSGGSTIFCMMKVLSLELAGRGANSNDPSQWQETLKRLRILIIHAGGDSKRVPAYSPCGKIFIPIPGESDSALGTTLFDRLLPVYLELPSTDPGKGQIVVTTGDVLLKFDPSEVRFDNKGITGLGCHASPEKVMNHGVFCQSSDGKVRLFLQKPSPAEQADKKAIDRYGQAILDIGIMNLDAASAVKVLQLCEIEKDSKGELAWTGSMGRAIENTGIDFYREICCAMGTEADFSHYSNTVNKSGSKLEERELKRIFSVMSKVPFYVHIVPQCGFLHFGTLRQIINSGSDLLSMDLGISHYNKCLSINNDKTGDNLIAGKKSWVEGCRIKSTLTLGGDNVVTGTDIEEPLSLPRKACLDVLGGRDKNSKKVWFVRCYSIDDTFKAPTDDKTLLYNQPISRWLRAIKAAVEDVWDRNTAHDERNIWNARIFPAVSNPSDYRKWLWVFDPSEAPNEQKQAWLEADRYSFAEMAVLADQEDFHIRRIQNRAEEIRRSLRQIFSLKSDFSASELAYILGNLDESGRLKWISDILKEAHWHFGEDKVSPGMERLKFSRIIHTLGSAISKSISETDIPWKETLTQLKTMLKGVEKIWLESTGLSVEKINTASEWARSAQDAAFENLSKTIVLSKEHLCQYPKNALRKDEIIWGRAPARLDLGGGWTDTPPYSLEHGGCVINAAVNINGQPPIHVHARVIEEPVIHIDSIDHSVSSTIKDFDELLDYRKPFSKFGLAKASLVLSGFSKETAKWPEKIQTLKDMLEAFGGGIELTTLAAIPSGSGLGTSSIMGAVLISVVHRLIGRKLTQRELFFRVLQLEQALTTGGGWQDQIGGAVAGVKVISTEPGLIPDPQIHYVPSDVLDPKINSGQTLFYYTGIRRLAKNILQSVVGNYLNRNRASMVTLKHLHRFPPIMAEAMLSKDMERFGNLIDLAWKLNKQIDPDSTTDVIEDILQKVNPYLYGAKLLGAGGGGFLLMICKSLDDAAACQEVLEKDPPNERAQFFDYDISSEGLVVTAC